MNKETSKPEGQISAKEKAAAQRAERLRKQLRQNLQRRKAQTRLRDAADASDKSD